MVRFNHEPTIILSPASADTHERKDSSSSTSSAGADVKQASKKTRLPLAATPYRTLASLSILKSRTDTASCSMYSKQSQVYAHWLCVPS